MEEHTERIFCRGRQQRASCLRPEGVGTARRHISKQPERITADGPRPLPSKLGFALIDLHLVLPDTDPVTVSELNTGSATHGARIDEARIAPQILQQEIPAFEDNPCLNPGDVALGIRQHEAVTRLTTDGSSASTELRMDGLSQRSTLESHHHDAHKRMLFKFQ
jgi:hypothetical protein